MTWKQKIKSFLVAASGILALVLSLASLATLLASIFDQGWSRLSLEFLTRFPSRFPAEAGIYSALLGTVWVISLTSLISIPVGIMTGIYIEEVASQNLFTRWVRINIANLSGVPSIIYGMLGLALFVRAMNLGRSVLSAALTMSLLILPTIIIATSEALKAVPASIRQGAYGVGATRRQVIWSHVIPEAMPGILTGIILAISRAVGESAPLILIGAFSFVTYAPSSVFDGFTVMAIQIFNWAGRPQDEFHTIAATAIIVLLFCTLSLNGIAIALRLRMRKT